MFLSYKVYAQLRIMRPFMYLMKLDCHSNECYTLIRVKPFLRWQDGLNLAFNYRGSSIIGTSQYWDLQKIPSNSIIGTFY